MSKENAEIGFEKLRMQGDSSHKDQKIDNLETELSDLKDRLLEERFYWLLCLVILIDMVFFMHMPPSWGGPIAIVFLESLGLIAAARKCKVDAIVEITDKILTGWVGQKK